MRVSITECSSVKTGLAKYPIWHHCPTVAFRITLTLRNWQWLMIIWRLIRLCRKNFWVSVAECSSPTKLIFFVEWKHLWCHVFNETSQTHQNRVISVIKWHHSIKNPKGISLQSHNLTLRVCKDASNSYSFQRICAKKSSGVDVFSRIMPSEMVKIKVEMALRPCADERTTSSSSTFFLFCNPRTGIGVVVYWTLFY